MTACEAPSPVLRPRPVPPAPARGGWEAAYRRTVLLADGAAALAAALFAYAVRPGADRAAWDGATYSAAICLAPLVWVAVLGLIGGPGLRHLGDGRDDVRTVLASAGLLLALVAGLTWVTPVQVPRDWVLLVLAVTVALTIAGRGWRRKALRTRWRRGECLHRVLAVGQPSAVRALVEHLARDRQSGAVVVGCCLPRRAGARSGQARAGHGRNGHARNGHRYRPGIDDLPVPVFGGAEDVVPAMIAAAADTVAVLPCPELEGSALRSLAWALEGRARHLVVVPGLVEVARPRLSLRPISGLSVVHVRDPRLAGTGWVVKALADRALALAALVLLAPLLLLIAAVVRATSPGPALFRQTRVGMHGREFTFLKFRTMQLGAEQRRDELISRNINADGLLFKVRDDPRVTPVGAFLRRWSLDELPQLVNVLMGHMSLVGPRPPLPQEVARYSDEVRRRLLVRPGLTGLWQVSGRSDLSWDDAVRLDLRYVDNWSLALDAAILSRTLPAVLNGSGAY